jgi:hypothetical protein
MSGRAAIKISLSGVAVVCCVHDREKRQIRTERQVAQLGRELGHVYDPKQHKIHDCACCENLFVDPTDEPKFCHTCRQTPKHALGGPLSEPIGVVYE